jgi:DNA-binding response OmpR family regulator
MQSKSCSLSSSKKKILVVSYDPHLADVHKSVLESAGFLVLPANDVLAVRKACREDKPLLIMIGYSLPPAEKRRVWVEARASCKVPVLELHEREGPSLMSPAYFHHSAAPDDFLSAVQLILNRKH